MNIGALTRPFRITEGRKFRLDDHPPDARGGLDIGKAEAKALLAAGTDRLAALQNLLYADGRWALLLIFQGMDASGKDGAIRHVMAGLNPLGCQAYSFRAPSEEERAHDFLWRHACRLPERGRIGIWNRSAYEEVLVVRVHPELLRGQKLPERLIGKRIWQERLEDIAAFERHLARSGTVILKFFLHISREEQKRRFMERLEMPRKHWKFDRADIEERAHWDAYMAAYEEAIRATAAPHAPWFVLPGDRKWFSRAVILAAVVKALEGLDLRFPEVPEEKMREIEEARRRLAAEDGEASAA
ncbi:MAG TPA: polyphosphate kinase 2 family protein [Rhodospirillales bacterium]|nr:polyphosphate kinase 2 family protein [Rhodospirillales bacterium]